MTEAQRAATKARDFRPFIIADADTGHGGDPHVRNLIRRFVEAGVPATTSKTSVRAPRSAAIRRKVLVAQDEQNKRLNAARFQLDVMGVPGLIVARTDAEAANLIEGRGDERDQPFLVGGDEPQRASLQAVLPGADPAFHELGVAELTGHLLYAIPAGEHTVAGNGWSAGEFWRRPPKPWRRCGREKRPRLTRCSTGSPPLPQAWEDDAELNTSGGGCRSDRIPVERR